MGRDSRKNERVNAVIPVRLEDGHDGITRDLSPAGVYFVTAEKLRDGEPIRFTLEFDNAMGKLYLDCSGQVVRVEDREGKVGVAVKITESRLERRESAPDAAARRTINEA
jgi:hypothetical protein